MVSQYENEAAWRRLQLIASHLGTSESEHVGSSINSMECNSTSKIESRHRETKLLLACQDSETNYRFFHQESFMQVQYARPVEDTPLFVRIAQLEGKNPRDSPPANQHKDSQESPRKGTEHILLIGLAGNSVEGLQVEVYHGRLVITGIRPVKWLRTSGSELPTITTSEEVLDFPCGLNCTVWQLPENVDTRAISAEYTNGILTVVIPKLKEK